MINFNKQPIQLEERAEIVQTVIDRLLKYGQSYAIEINKINKDYDVEVIPLKRIYKNK